MKVPLFWLREYVDVGDLAAVSQSLVMAGVGTEGVEGDVLDLEITANRADLLSMLSVAREMALLTDRPLRKPEIPEGEIGTLGVPVTVEDPALCPRYTARIVEGVTVGPSSAPMQKKLLAAGLRPVNNIVDITNFVLLECGQPLHAFDLARLLGPEIVVRPARGEKMIAIDGKEYPLDPERLVIADRDRPVAIAGVMGGQETEISERTRDVLIESAQFDPVSIRRTARRLGLSSESSYRFERGVDWDSVDWASRRAAQLMAELAGGKVVRGMVDVASTPPTRPVARVRPERVKIVLGLDVAPDRIREILRRLGCEFLGPPKGPGDLAGIQVAAPRGRRDLRIEVDYIEEVARVEGYDRIPSDATLRTRVVADRRDDLVREGVRSALVGMGCFEVLTWSFSTGNDDTWAKGEPVALRDPAGNVDRRLRKAMGPALLEVLKTNEDYKEPLLPIFEIAKVYYPHGSDYSERAVLAIATPRGYLHLKGLVERVLARVGLKPGDVTAHLSESRELRCDAAVAEIDFEEVARKAKLERKFHDFSRKPPVVRDLAVVLDEAVSWETLAACVRGAAPATLERIEFFDIYRGKPVPSGKKSVAFSMAFRAPDRTLTGDEVDTAVRRIVDAVATQLSGTLRQ